MPQISESMRFWKWRIDTKMKLCFFPDLICALAMSQGEIERLTGIFVFNFRNA